MDGQVKGKKTGHDEAIHSVLHLALLSHYFPRFFQITISLDRKLPEIRRRRIVNFFLRQLREMVAQSIYIVVLRLALLAVLKSNRKVY